MGEFTAEVVAKFHPEKNEWEVLETFFFCTEEGDTLMVPKGFLTDLASTKNAPGFPRDDVYNQAAILHDYLYASEIFPRKICDDIFKEALNSIDEVKKWRIPIMYFFVRVFGGFTYKEHTKDSIANNRRLANIRNTVDKPLWKDGIARFI